MSRFTSISNDIWSDKEFKNLSPIGKNVYLFVLTNPQGNQSGIYRLPLDLVEFYLGEEGAEEIKKENKLFKYDVEKEIVFIPNYLKYNVAKSQSQLKAMSRNIASLPYCELLVDFCESLVKYSGDEALKYLPDAVKGYVSKRAKKENREHLFITMIDSAY